MQQQARREQWACEAVVRARSALCSSAPAPDMITRLRVVRCALLVMRASISVPLRCASSAYGMYTPHACVLVTSASRLTVNFICRAAARFCYAGRCFEVGYGYGYILGPISALASPVPPTPTNPCGTCMYLAGVASAPPAARGPPRGDIIHALSRASRCGGSHPTSPLSQRLPAAYPVHARRVPGRRELGRCCIMKPPLAVG